MIPKPMNAQRVDMAGVYAEESVYEI